CIGEKLEHRKLERKRRHGREANAGRRVEKRLERPVADLRIFRGSERLYLLILVRTELLGEFLAEFGREADQKHGAHGIEDERKIEIHVNAGIRSFAERRKRRGALARSERGHERVHKLVFRRASRLFRFFARYFLIGRSGRDALEHRERVSVRTFGKERDEIA